MSFTNGMVAGLRRRAARSVLRHRDLRLAVLARAVSFLGDEIALIALVLRLHDDGADPRAIAALLLAAALPLVLLAPAAGALVDRYDSRTLIVTAGSGQVGACLLLAVADGLPAVLALVVLLQAGQAVTGPAWQALIPRMVGEADVGRAVGAQQGLTTLFGVAGPAVGGLLTQQLGPALPLLVDAATFAVVAVAGAAIRTRRVPSTAGPDAGRLLSGLWDGYRFLLADRLLAVLFGTLTIFVLVGEMTNVAEVFLVRDVLGGSAGTYGLYGAVFATALVAGALLGARPTGERTLVLLALGSAAVLGAGLVGIGLSPSVGVLLACAAVAGAANGAVNVAVTTVLVRRTPDCVRGRVFAAVGGASRGASTGSLVAGGALASFLQPGAVFVVAGALGVATVLAAAPAVRRSLPAPRPRPLDVPSSP